MWLKLFPCTKPHNKFSEVVHIFESTNSSIYKGLYDNKEVAIKYCYYDAKREIENLSVLKGVDGVLQLFHSEYKKKESVLIFEFCHGGDLFTWVKTSLDKTLIKVIMRILVKNVLICHEKGIIHCDIKLDNIGLLVKNDINTLTILDFGSSIKVQDYVPEKHNFVISPQYAAPELCRQEIIKSENLQHIDFWSLGIVAYILATGCYPAHKISQDCHCDPHFKSVIGPIKWDKCEFEHDFNIFLHGLLDRDVYKRYNDTTIRNDKWLFGK